MKMKKRFLGILFSLVMVLGLMPGMSLTAKADGTTVTTADGFKTAVGNGGSISLGSDITLTLDQHLSFNKVTTTDLNGHTLTLNSEKRFLVDAQVIIKDGVGNGKITTSHNDSLFVIRDGGSMKLEGGTLENTYSDAQVIDAYTGPFTMTGGMIKSSGKSIWRDGARVTISGGTIIGDLKGSSGIIDITGGKFSFDPSSLLSSEYKSAKAGEYWVVSAAHTHSFTYSSSGATITATCSNTGCTLTAIPTLTIVKPTLETYGQTGKSAVATLDGLDAFKAATSLNVAETDIKYVGRGGTSYAESGTAPTDAGKYTAKITLSGVKTSAGDNQSVTASVDYEIAKAATSVTTPPTASEITYGKTLADSSLTGGTASVAGTFAWKDTTIVPAVSDSQKTEFIVVFTPTNTNYGTTECKVKLTVNKTAATVTAPTAKALTYTGSAQELVNAGSTKDGKLYYAVTAENTAPTDESLYTTSIPTGTDAGTYYVWYKVKGDENHNDTAPADPVTVTIKAAGLTILCDPENGGRVELVGSGEDYFQYTAIPAEGWKFQKWTYNANVSGIGPQEFSGKDAFFMFTATDIVAHFVEDDAETVTITFDAAGGTGTMAPVQIEKGSQYTLPNSSFIPPANQVFAHWKIGEKPYAVNDGITVNADLTVTAVWTEEKSEDKESKIVLADLTSVPNELKNKFSSIKDLKDTLLRALSSQGMFTSEENSVFYDVVLMVRRNGGPWVPATKEDFENGPLTVKLAYPSGTGMNTHNFKVAHMFTTNVHRHQPGQIEIPAVTKKEDGIYVDLDGLSPVAVSWTKIDEKAIGSLPQTGDTAKPLLYGFLALIALVGLGLLIKKK